MHTAQYAKYSPPTETIDNAAKWIFANHINELINIFSPILIGVRYQLAPEHDLIVVFCNILELHNVAQCGDG